MTVIEQLQADLAAAKAEVAKIESEIAALPSKFHTYLSEEWAEIKAFFHANPAAAAPTPAPTVAPSEPAPPAA